MKINKMIETLEDKILDLKEDAEKVDNGNKAACTRLRVGLMGIIKECKTIRDKVLKVKKG